LDPLNQSLSTRMNVFGPIYMILICLAPSHMKVLRRRTKLIEKDRNLRDLAFMLNEESLFKVFVGLDHVLALEANRSI